MTALTVYQTSVAATTLATAGKLAATTGGTASSKTTQIGTSTGWFELQALNNNTAATVASQPGPTGKGWLLDATTLEGQTIAAGTWTPSVNLKTSVGTATVTIVERYYLYSNGWYTLLGTSTKSGQGLTTTASTITGTAVSLAAIVCSTGDKLYIDRWVNVTANSTGSGVATVTHAESSTSTGVTTGQSVTPGYAATSYTYTSNPFTAAILADSPSAFLPLDEPSGNWAHDISGNGYNGAILGGVTVAQSGPPNLGAGTSFSFDGSTGSVTIAPGLDLASATAASWEIAFFQPSGAAAGSGNPRILDNSHTDASNAGFQIAPDKGGGGGFAYIGNGTSTHDAFWSNNPWTTGVWHYISVIFNGTSLLVYFDNVQVGNASFTAFTLADDANKYPITIGAGAYANDYSNARIAYVAVWKGTALTTTQRNAHYAAFIARGIPTSAALLATLTRSVPSSASLLATNTRSVPATAALLQTATRSVPSSAALLATNTRNAPASAALLATNTRAIPTSAALQATAVRSFPASVALQATNNRTVATSAALLATNARAAPASAALLATNTRSVPTSVALLGTRSRAISSTAALLATNTRTVPSSAALLATNTRSIPTTVALAGTGATRAIPTSAALLATLSRTVTSAAALTQTNTRAIPTQAALLATLTRSIPSSAALLATRQRSISASAALSATGQRTILASVALLLTASRSIPTTATIGVMVASTPGSAIASDAPAHSIIGGDNAVGGVSPGDVLVANISAADRE